MTSQRNSVLLSAFVALLVYSGSYADQDDQLLQVQVLFRHGDRTPTEFFGDDPYANFDYPEGIGGLTNSGKARLNWVGSALRQRYELFIENLPTKNIRALSSPKPRVIESGLSLLSGFFPPSPSQIWSNGTELARQWQPIAIESASPNRAYLLGEGGCPEVDRLIPLVHELPLCVQFWYDNQEFVAQVNKTAGVNFTIWSDVANQYDTLLCEKNYFGEQFQEPQWINQVGANTWQKLEEFRKLQFVLYGMLPHEFKRLQAGPFLKDMLQNLQTTAAQIGSGGMAVKKVFTFGTHDTVMAPILHVLGIFKEQPRYGSGIIVELRSSSQSHLLQVHLIYLNVTETVTFTPLPLNESETFKQLCPNASCSIEGFSQSLQSFIPDDIEKECGLDRNGARHSNSTAMTTLLIIGFALALAANLSLLSFNCIGISKQSKIIKSGYISM